MASAAPASPFAGDERAAKLAERYKVMLAANPAEGIALDRLWKAYEDHDATGALLEEYRAKATGNGGVSEWLAYGNLLNKAGRFEDAAAAYEEAARADPTGPLPPLARGKLALAQHHPEDAANLFADAAAKLAPNSPLRGDLWLTLGNAWLAAGQPGKAVAAWEQLVAASSANLTLHKQLAQTYARNGLIDNALAHWTYIDQHADPPARAAALREAGRLHEGRGDFDAAREAFERALALTSRDNWLHAELLGAIIRLYERAGRTAELESRWRQTAEQTPRDLGGYLRLETLAETQGDTKAELEWLDRITALAPRDRDSRLKLARLLVDRGDRERAAAAYDQLLKEQPGQLDLIFARADLDLQSGAASAAVGRVEARLAQSPADETIFAPMLEFFLSRHLDEPAERCLRAACDRQSAALEPGLALAKFFFTRRRTDEGRQVLNRLASETAGPTAPAERWERIAGAFKEANLSEDALRCWREAARAAPHDPGPLESASELLLARGETRAAASALQQAAEIAPEGAAREEIEHRLFQTLPVGFEPGSTAAPGTTGPAGPHARRRGYIMSPGAPGRSMPPETPAVAPGSALDQYLEGLEILAGKEPTPGNLLRLARWQAWARLPEEAAASAERVVELEPTNLPARQLLIRVAKETHQYELAARRLREIAALDPTHQTAYQRELAGLQMEDGDFDAALVVYGQVQAAQPGAVEPLIDLALAEQRADRWFDALATWRRAYALPSLTPAQRTDVRRPLLATYEHLGEFQPAAELLVRAIDEQPEPARKQELFQELSEFCGKHALNEWLDGQCEARLRAQPEDYFNMVAVAERWKNQGREEEAYRLLGRAYYSAPDPVAALKSLADEAEALGEEDQAVADRRRLAGMAGQNTAENLEKLAALEEAMDAAGAARTWELITARFPRAINSLAHAAEFFERIGQPAPARALLDQIVSIEPEDLPHLFHSAELARDAGDAAAARSKFEAVLARSETEKSGEAFHPPPELEAVPDPSVGLGSLPIFYRAAPAPPRPKPVEPGRDDHILRLQAIRELACLLPAPNEPSGAVDPSDRGARGRWRERWRQAAAMGLRSEPLQALYSSGDVPGTMDLLGAWMSAQPADDRLRVAFVLAGLRMEDYGRLARWAWLDGEPGPRVARGLQLVEAVLQFLVDGGRPGANMVGELFPPSVRARDLLWKVAKLGFAERHWYPQAAELGERVLALAATGRSAYAVELAQWELFLDHPDQARAALRSLISEEGSVFLGSSGGSAVYEALRACYLLLPPPERPAFVEAYLQGWRARGDRVHLVLSALLLHGLQGDEVAARRDLDALLAMRLAEPENGDRFPDARRWGYVLDTGVQLENWNLGSLAASLWQKSLDGQTAFDRADAEVQGTLAEISSRLLVLQAAQAADPEARRECVRKYLAGNPRTDLVRAAASQFMAASDFPAARQLYEFLIREEPADAENWRGLLGACDADHDLDAVEEILVTLLEPLRQLPPALNRAELVRDLAAVHQSEGDDAGALRLLEREFQAGTRSLPVVTALAQAYERAGALDDAGRVWQEGMAGDYGNARTYRLALAALEERRGNLQQAISWLEAEVAGKASAGTEEAVARLASLYLRTGRSEQAKDLTLSMLKTNDLEFLPGIAQAFTQAGQQPQLRGWLRTAIHRSRDPQTRFLLQQQSLQNDPAAPAGPPADFTREMRRLATFGQATPTLKSAYAAARYTLARQHGADRWLEGELQREWKQGQGDFPAGEQLVSFYLDTRQEEPLRRVIEAITLRPNLPEPALASIEQRLGEAGFATLALPVSERLFRCFPGNESYAFARARLLWKTGQTAEARRLLEAFDRSSVFREDLSTRIGAVYEELGDPESARALYERAMRQDLAGARSTAACLRLAQMATQRGNLAEVRRLLRIAYRQPATANDLAPLVDFLQASSGLAPSAAHAQPGSGFSLDFTKRAQLLERVYQRLKSLGRLPEAQELVAAHPGFLAGSPLLTAGWRQDARPEQSPVFIGMLEEVFRSQSAPSPRLSRDLAALYVRWSDDAANAARPDPAERLDHLLRARQFAPDDFEIARRIAALCWENHRPSQAEAALQPFLASNAVPAEREQARVLLDHH